MDFLETSVMDLAAKVRAGEIASVSLVEHALDRIAALNPSLNAFVAVDGAAALAAAAAVDAKVAGGDDPGPLAGIPIGVKDLEDAAGFATTFGSPLFADASPAESDSILVGRMRAAGAVVVGKTNTPEFGHKGTTDNELFGTTANPWDLTRTPGGSSGGSAAAVASGMVPLTTGSDGGGSIRIPAALCGLTGLKTQQGRIPYRHDGQRPAMLLSVSGPMARTAAETGYTLDALRGPHWADPFSLPPDDRSWFAAATDAAVPERVVWAPTMGFADVDPGIAELCQASVDKLAAAGTEVVVDDSVFDEQPLYGWSINWFSYLHKLLGPLRGTDDWGKVSPLLRAMVERGAELNGDDAVEGLQRMFARNHDIGAVLDKHDAQLLLCPSTARMPPTLAEIEAGGADLGWVQFTFAINMTRHPAGSVCVGKTGNAPVGLQVIGRHFDEPGVLGAMAAVENLVEPIGRPAALDGLG